MVLQAASDAREEWNQRRASMQHFGDIYSDRPLIHPSGLYVSICWDEDYARAYNEEIRKLLETHGMPEWAPGNRLPDRERCLVLLEEGLPFDQYQATFKKEERLVTSQARRWTEEHGTRPEVFVRLDRLDLLLLGGSTGNAYRIDVLDIAQHVWMWTHEPRGRPG